MQGSRNKIAAFALAAVAAMAAPAFAQDYTTSTVSNKYLTPPGSATTLTFGNADDGATSITLPFTFPYFGSSYSSASVCTNGFVQFGGGSSSSLSNTTLPASGTNDGVVALMWMDLNPRSAGSVKTWTTGQAPNRVFVVGFQGVPRFGGNITMSLQAQFFETTGRIILAYGTETSWDATGYTTGIDAIGSDTRFVYAPGKSGNNNSGKPSDYQFDPAITNITGRVLIDEIVSDSSGLGNSVNAGVPPTGLSVELRGSNGTSGFGTVDADGDFSIRGVALVSADSGEVVVVAETPACSVSPSTSTTALVPAYAKSIATGISFGTDSSIGTKTLDSDTDTDQSARKAIQIALQVTKIHTWVTARTEDAIPQIPVFFTDAAALGTNFAAGNATTPPSIRIGGSGSGNLDAFDAAVVARVYTRHVLSKMNGIISSTYTADINASTDDRNALADAFGHYLFAIANDATRTFDGTSSSATTEFDLETPGLSSTPASDVAGWGAAAFFDLIDAGNETHDAIDGTVGTAAERPFLVVDALTEGATPPDFLDEWDRQGFDSAGLASNFIRHGLLADDAAEPNDTADTAFDLGQAGVRQSKNILNRFNEDWFEVLVPGATPAFLVEMKYNRFDNQADITLEIRTVGGSVLATGVPDGENGPIRAITGGLGPGPVYIRIAHNSGDLIDDYTVQAFSRIAVSTSGVPEWTVRRTINQAIQITGGIAPYTLRVKPGSQLPRGMILDDANGRLIGSPLDVGTVTFTVEAADAGDPLHSGSFTQAFKINSLLSFSAPALTGVALSRETDVNLGRLGGTNPITVDEFTGTLPNGLTLTEDFHIRGTATEPGGGDLTLKATDLAGSTATMETTLVVCIPVRGKNEQLPFAAGDAAAGYYFDALAGGTINLKIKTAKKRAKRAYDVLVLGPDGNIVVGGKVKVKAGTIIMKKVPTPRTGRYFVAFSSSDGGDETQLLGTLKTALPKKGAGALERLELGEQFIVEFGALSGASFTLKGKTTDLMEIAVDFIIQPDGTPIPFNAVTVANKKGKVTITVSGLTQDGTYAIYMQPRKTDLADFAFKFKLKQPKGGAFSID